MRCDAMIIIIVVVVAVLVVVVSCVIINVVIVAVVNYKLRENQVKSSQSPKQKRLERKMRRQGQPLACYYTPHDPTTKRTGLALIRY